MSSISSDYDKYVLSKYYPGKYKPKWVYGPVGELAASMATSNGYSVTHAYSLSSSSALLLGTDKYLVMMYWPALSMLWARDAQSPLNGQQLSGLVTIQGDNLVDTITFNDFVGLDAAGGASHDQSGRSAISVFGTQSTPDLTAYVCSSEIDFRFVIPAATLTGTMYRGSLRLGSFFNAEVTAQTTNMSLTIGQLVSIATSVQSMQTSFKLSSAIVNDNLHSLFGAARKSTETALPFISDNMLNFGSEIIDYVVIQQPAISISTGIELSYSLIGEVSNNFAIYPSPRNLLLYKTFNPIWSGKQHSKLEGVGYHGSVHGAIKPPTSDVDLSKFTKKLPSVVDGTGMGDSNALASIPPSKLYGFIDDKYDQHQFLVSKTRQELIQLHDDIEEHIEARPEGLSLPPAMAMSIALGGLKLLGDTVYYRDVPKPVRKKLNRQYAAFKNNDHRPNPNRGSQMQVRNQKGHNQEKTNTAQPNNGSKNTFTNKNKKDQVTDGQDMTPGLVKKFQPNTKNIGRTK